MARVLVIERDREVRGILVSYLKISLEIRRSDIVTAKSHWTAIHVMDENSNELKVAIVGKISEGNALRDEQNLIYILENHLQNIKTIFCTGHDMVGRGINVPRPEKESIGQVIRDMSTVKDILLEAL